MIEQSPELIAKARRFAAMSETDLNRQMVRTLLGDLALALEQATSKDRDNKP